MSLHIRPIDRDERLRIDNPARRWKPRPKPNSTIIFCL